MRASGRIRAVLDRLGWGPDAAGLFEESIEFTEDAAGTTHVGGLPRLDDGTWPRAGGRPLACRACIDLSALPRIPQLAALPRQGWLNAFYGWVDVAPRPVEAGLLVLASPGAPEVPLPGGLRKYDYYPPLPLVPRVRVNLSHRTDDPRSREAAAAMPELDEYDNLTPLRLCTHPRILQDFPELPGFWRGMYKTEQQILEYQKRLDEVAADWGVFLLFDQEMCSVEMGNGIVHWWLRHEDLAAGELGRVFVDCQAT